ncbi:DnaB helicase C-terminal domain-containing protein [Oceanobacillus chungangensis]|uniref:SF4 helicase domain-containing protein n=1 Tax=Oceanobacillus chungangensis TaxID=1229152 RepID=A0A3D8PNI5_9BACI|nr:DnaB helicase C-terminal domain-containing protein [Oceanobacillus chungangensis]RDW16715.1 hypothetical protein CWR45_13895 [Oceanobacillus chungangensis]
MNYIKQLNAFKDYLAFNELPSKAILLWHTLMLINNMVGWKRRFNAPNALVQQYGGLSKQRISEAREILVSFGLIHYKRGANGRAHVQQGCITSYEELDNMTGGLQRGDLLVVAARPSVGKTAFALNLAAGHCKQGGSAQVFSLEMGTKQLLQRMLSAEGAINCRKWRTTAFTEEDYQRAVRAIGVISNWNLDVYDKKRTILEIRAAIRKRIHDAPDGNHLVIIDYLQLITPAKQRDRRDLEVGEITRELKMLAIELNIPILLISQLSRNVESRQNKRPLMSNLHESGNIEQDADVIFFLHRADYYENNPKQKNRMEVIISKHRNGLTGTVQLVFEKEYGWFGEVG